MERRINYPDGYNGSPLHTMFNLQLGLIEHYVKIESMPDKINISERSGQLLMKEFIRRGVEELSEAHDIYIKIFEQNNIGQKYPADLVLEFNEELSDALHFLIEAMIYSNIMADDIAAYYQKLARELDVTFYTKNPLQTIVLISRFSLAKQGYDLSENGFMLDVSKEEAFFRNCAGRRISKSLLFDQAQLMWDVTHNFCKATNLLKNNPWKQREEETDVNGFQHQMMNGWRALMDLLIFSGYDGEGMLLSYCHKNATNKQRIKEKR